MSNYGKSRLAYDEHEKILEPNCNSILKSLGDDGGAKIFLLEKTENGYRFVECCDSYYGVTLSEDQFKQLIKEMTDLLQAKPTG